MAPNTPFRVLIAGGGVAALEAALTLHALGGDRLDVTLVSPADTFRFRPLTSAEPFAEGRAGSLSLAAFCADVGARHERAAVQSVDAATGEVVLDDDRRLGFDALLIAVGARPVPALEHARTWFDETDPDVMGGLLRDLEEGYARRVAFVIPTGCGWPLPAYELALMTAREVWGMGVDGATVTLVTYEDAPLSVFGPHASEVVAKELAEAGVALRTDAYVDAERSGPGRLALRPGDDVVTADRIIALPRLEGRRIAGVPANRQGFLPVDPHGRVIGADGVWAAGDGTAFPIKQGGVAAQQAEVAATSIAAAAGLDVEEVPFEPVLRGTLLTGARPWHMRWAPGEGDGLATRRALWWPPTKVAGRRLSPYLAEHLDAPAGVPVHLAVTPDAPGLTDLDPTPQPSPAQP